MIKIISLCESVFLYPEYNNNNNKLTLLMADIYVELIIIIDQSRHNY